MAKHLWETQKFLDRTVELYKSAFDRIWVTNPAQPDFELALTFCAYALENLRQSGSRRGGCAGLTSQYWAGAEKSNHRYARGRNAQHYFEVGHRLLATWGVRFGPFSGEEGLPNPSVVADWLLEQHQGSL